MSVVTCIALIAIIVQLSNSCALRVSRVPFAVRADLLVLVILVVVQMKVLLLW